MKKIYLSASAALILMLSACTGNPVGNAAKQGIGAAAQSIQQSVQQQTDTAVFKCDNGSDVLVHYQNADRIVIAHGKGSQRDIIPMNRTRAASGELYVSADRKIEWHQKNKEAVFGLTNHQGQPVSTICRI
ncbi:MAG: MliC family protein [Neisseria sp.]|nr:MliC family protein [Neisseria sp.]